MKNVVFLFFVAAFVCCAATAQAKKSKSSKSKYASASASTSTASLLLSEFCSDDVRQHCGGHRPPCDGSNCTHPHHHRHHPHHPHDPHEHPHHPHHHHPHVNRTCVELNKELMSPECQAAMSDGDSGSGAVREACKNDFRRLCTPEENSRAQESGPGRTLRGGKGKSHKNGGKNKDKDQDEGKDERRGRRGRGGNKHKGERGGKDGDYARHRERFDELKKCIEEQKRLFSEACQAAMAAHDEQHNSTAAAAGTGKDEPTTSTTTMMPLPTAAASLAFVRVEEEEQAEAELNGYHRNHHGHWLHDHLKAVVIAGAAGGLALISLVIVVRRRRRRSKCSCHATKARPEEPSEQSEELPAVKTVVVSAPVVVA